MAIFMPRSMFLKETNISNSSNEKQPLTTNSHQYNNHFIRFYISVSDKNFWLLNIKKYSLENFLSKKYCIVAFKSFIYD